LKRLIIAGLVLAVSCWAISRCFFVCSETEEVLVTQFGRIMRSVGAAPGQAGLKLKAPWEGLIRVDRRSHVSTLSPTEIITSDKKNLEIGLAIVWRVSDSKRFMETVLSPAEAQARLSERATAQAAQIFAKTELADIISTNPKRKGPDALGRMIASDLNASVKAAFGIEISSVLVRQIAYPTEIRPAIFDQIRAERAQVASRIRAESKAKSDSTLAQANRDRETELAKARSESDSIRSAAEAEALGILNEAHAQDPKLYELVRMLETYRALADQKTTVILSSGSPLWKLLWQGPSIDFAGDSPPPPGVGPAPEPISPSPLAPRIRPELLEKPK
jgi:membrane protease subunit HflC